MTTISPVSLWALPFAASFSSPVTSCFSFAVAFLPSRNHLLFLWVYVCGGWGRGGLCPFGALFLQVCLWMFLVRVLSLHKNFMGLRLLPGLSWDRAAHLGPSLSQRGCLRNSSRFTPRLMPFPALYRSLEQNKAKKRKPRAHAHELAHWRKCSRPACRLAGAHTLRMVGSATGDVTEALSRFIGCL